MNRREFIKQTAVVTVAMPSLLRAQTDDRPNIVLFLADDMTWRDCFEVLKTTGSNELLDSDASIRVIQDFIDREPGEPYCLVVASRNPHLPYTKGPQDMYDPDKVTIPPYLIDTPETRKRLAAYYAEITALDAELGQCLQIISDNTLVVFSTEQGSAFPYGGKWTCYENGLHTGLIMRWPGKIEAGSSCDALVQYVDILPTLLQNLMRGWRSKTIAEWKPNWKRMPT